MSTSFIAPCRHRITGVARDAYDREGSADGDWRAAAWRLGRRYPKQYGRQQRVEHSTADGKPLKVDLSILSDDELAVLKARLEKLGELGNDRYSEFQLAFAKGLIA